LQPFDLGKRTQNVIVDLKRPPLIQRLECSFALVGLEEAGLSRDAPLCEFGFELLGEDAGKPGRPVQGERSAPILLDDQLPAELRPTAQQRPDGVLEDRISILVAPDIY
jgi:hypothetical protein